MDTCKKPSIRFQGFEGDWEEDKLGNLALFSKGTGYSKADIKDSGIPLILYGRLYTKYETVIKEVDTFAEIKNGSVFSRGGEVIVPASGETAEDISVASVVAEKGVLLGGDLNIVKPTEFLNSTFLAISISNGKPHDDMAKMAQGKSVVHLHNSDLEKINLLYPKATEQKQIADFFSNLDSLLTLRKKKLEKLKNFKRSCLEKMFPKDGDSVPELRFDGFEGEWEKRKLGEYLSVSDEKNKNGLYDRNDVFSVSGDFGIVNQIEFQGRSFAGASLDNYGVVEQGDVVYTKSPLNTCPYGIIKTNKRDTGIVSVLYAVYHPTSLCNSNFVQTYFEQNARLNNYLRPLISKGAKNTINISDETALSGFVTFPSYEEQYCISKFFAKIDELINLERIELEKLQNLKKAYLEKMFV